MGYLDERISLESHLFSYRYRARLGICSIPGSCGTNANRAIVVLFVLSPTHICWNRQPGNDIPYPQLDAIETALFCLNKRKSWTLAQDIKTMWSLKDAPWRFFFVYSSSYIEQYLKEKTVKKTKGHHLSSQCGVVLLNGVNCCRDMSNWPLFMSQLIGNSMLISLYLQYLEKLFTVALGTEWGLYLSYQLYWVCLVMNRFHCFAWFT